MTLPAYDTIPAQFLGLDPRFAKVRGDSRIQRLFTDGRWLEGPAYSVQGRYLLFSDIPNNRTLKLDESSGVVSEFDSPSNFANGRTIDPMGRTVTCLHGSRSVERLEHDGRVTRISSAQGGKQLNSPNDVITDRSGTIYFTDPTYGILSDYEGHAGSEELDCRGVYRWSDGMNEPELIIDELRQPNGLALSPDGSVLYVVDSERGTISDYDLSDGTVSGRVIVESDLGFDGIKVDASGRLWAATRGGISCFSAGDEIGRLRLPEPAANLCFGGIQRNILYITATTSLYAIRLNTTGMP